MTFRNVILNGTKLLLRDCEAEWCSHCPGLPYTWPGQVDFTVIENYPAANASALLSPRCNTLDSYGFVSMSDADLIFQNTIIDNIRIQSRLFVKMNFNSTLVMTNVIISRMDFFENFIKGQFSTILNTEVRLEHVTVWGFNRDRAFVKGYNKQKMPNRNRWIADVGFLYISGVAQVILEDCVFEDNFQLQEDENLNKLGTITIKGEFDRFVLRSCVFHRGMHKLYLEWLPQTGQTKTRANVLISNCTFEGDFAIQQPYLSISGAKEIDVVLENSKFVNITTKFRTFLDITLLSTSTCVINNTQFINNRAYLQDNSASLIVPYHFTGNVTMESCIFTENSSVSPPNLFVQLLAAHLINNSPDVYEAFIYLVDGLCPALITQEAWFSTRLDAVTVRGFKRCDVLYLASDPLPVEMIFHVDNLKTLDAAGLAVRVVATTKLPFTCEILNSHFGTVISIDRTGGLDGRLSIRNCTFEHSGIVYSGNRLAVAESQFTGSSRGAINYFMTGNAALEVGNTRFSGNTGEFEGADITVRGSSASTDMDLLILHCVFEHYVSPYGSLFFDSPFFSQAFIRFGNFSHDQAIENSGVIVTTHLAGNLTLEDVSFRCNDANSYLFLINNLKIPNLLKETWTVLRRVKVENSVFKAALKCAGKYWAAQLETVDCIFQDNTGIVIWSEVGLYHDFHSRFENNTSDKYPCYYQAQQSNATFVGSTFRHNTASSLGSVYFRYGNSFFRFQNCLFEENMGDVLHVEQSVSVEISGSVFTANNGFALHLSNIKNASFSINNSQFVGTQSSSPYLYSRDSSLSLTSVSFVKGGIQLINSEFKADSCTFAYLETETTGCLVLAQQGSRVILTNSHVNSIKCEKEIIHLTRNSKLTLENCELRNLSSASSIVSATDSVIQISTGTIHSITTSIAFVYAGQTNVTVSDSTIVSIDGLVFSSQSSQFFSLSHSHLDFVTSPRGFLQVQGRQVVYLSDVSVNHVWAQEAGAKLEVETVNIDSCEFRNVKGGKHGGLFIQAASLTLHNTSFTDNAALSGGAQGGALTLFQTPAIVQNCSFLRNEAYIGGALYWTGKVPLLLFTTFSENRGFDAPGVASQIEKMVRLSTTGVLEFASGQVFKERIVLGLVDHYNQLVTSESHNTAVLFGNFLGGQLTATFRQGILTFSNFSASGIIGSEANLTVLYNSMISLRIPVRFRACRSGELLKNDTCVVCAKSTYSVAINASVCLRCPSDAECPGDGKLYPLPGAWCPTPFFDGTFDCPYALACTGHQNYTSLRGECADLYQGNKCQSCASGSSRSGLDKCAKCPEPTLNKLLIAFAAIVVVVIVIVLSRSAWVGATKKKSQTSTSLKIFLNYVHMISLVARFHIDWPSTFESFLVFHEYAGSSGEQQVSLDCLFPDPTFNKITVIAVLPLALLAINAAVWGLVWVLFRSIGRPLQIQGKLTCSTIISLFYFHPLITRISLSIFECTTILPGEQWLRVEMGVRCWNQRHSFYALLAALPAVLLWSMGIPALVLLLLIRYRKRLSEERILKMVGYLCASYKPHLYFWEIILMYRKVAIILLYIFVSSLSVAASLLSLLLLLVTSAWLQLTFSPFHQSALNHAELLNIFTVLSTAYAGLFFNYGLLSNAASLLLVLVVILINCAFLLYLVKSATSHIPRLLASRLRRCLLMRKHNLKGIEAHKLRLVTKANYWVRLQIQSERP